MGCMNSKDSLNKVDMDYLKNNTRFDQKAIDDWYKGFKKDCPDGHLTQTKFTAIFKYIMLKLPQNYSTPSLRS